MHDRAVKVVTFGEIMMRLQPDNHERFMQTDHVGMIFGGAEANVAVSLANFGLDSVFVTKLPQHTVGQAAVNALRRYGVDTGRIVRGGDRLGIYFVEKGASQRASVCIYDRAHSAIQESDPAEFDWDAIFDGADWFHFSGITPALGPNLAEACLEACRAAKAKGMTVSCDLNYRKKLWDSALAQEVMSRLCAFVDLCILNEEDAKNVFGIEAKTSDVTGEMHREEYASVAKQLAERFAFSKIAITLRESESASVNRWSAMLCDTKDGTCTFSQKYHVHVIDRIGTGDSFAGGLIYALANHYADRQALEFAVAASALKHTVEGDFNLFTVEEVEKLAAGNGSGRIER